MKIIITGSTGMVGKSIVLEALEDKRITAILLINRRSLGIQNPKVKEVLLADFSQIETIGEQLVGYDAVYHCMGVSAVGMSEEEYIKITFDLTKKLVDTLYEQNPKMMVCYVSGSGTDTSEKGRVMWARVKGKTENYILSKAFDTAYMIRLGAIYPEKNIKSKTNWYNYIYVLMRPFSSLFKKFNNIMTTTNFGKAMLNLLFYAVDETNLDNKAMNRIALMN